MFTLGHIIRDGWPALGSSTFARVLGAAVCSIILFVFYNWIEALILAASVLAGFYIDQKHGEGQQAKEKADFKWLIISGTTSVLTTVVALAALGYYINAGILFAFGLFKPAYWKLSWAYFSNTPTRWAAGIFGFLYGLAVLWGKW